jgi:N-formylglutamate amidohydrolase
MTFNDTNALYAEFSPPFDVRTPEVQTAPFVFCSPHSGRIYPQEFLAQSKLDPLTLRKSEDCFIDDLFSAAAELGAAMISARFPRAFLDLNREPYELDPLLFEGQLPDFANSQSVRVAGGLGTIARVVADGEEIYRKKIPLKSGLERIDRLYFPFHAELARLIEATRRRFGYAILIDCHSMPSASMVGTQGPRPDAVLGDRFGAASDARVSRTIKETFQNLKFDVQMNRPYAGGYITEHYGRPQRGIHAVQIELNRALYLDEAALTPNAGYASLKGALRELTAALFANVPPLLERRLAAE